MAKIEEIVVWDISAQRIHVMEKNVKNAMRRLGVRARVQFNSEEPLLSRFRLLGKTPAVQINKGDLWTCVPGRAISEEAFIRLLRLFMEQGPGMRRGGEDTPLYP